MGTSALPDIYACARGQVRIYRQSTSARGITTMLYFSMQTYLIGKIFSCYICYIGNQVSCDVGLKFAKQAVIVGFNLNFNASNSSLILLLLI